VEKVVASIREASEALSLSRSRIYELIDQGKLRRVKIGRRALIPVESIRQLIEEAAA
jgi:excisionase family DNA binding protein